MKKIIKFTILCVFVSLYSISEAQIPEKSNTQATKDQKESTLKKKTLKELVGEIVTDKKFWDGILGGLFLVVPLYIEKFTAKTKVDGYLLSDFEPLGIGIREVISMFTSVGKSAQAYLFQHYSLRHLRNQVKEIFNIHPEKIFLVTSDNNERSAGKSFIFMPFKDAIDITKLKEFFGVLAHEVVHLKNNHFVFGKFFRYACFIPLMYGMYKIALKIKNDIEKNSFEDLFKKNHNTQKKQNWKKIILYGLYVSVLSGLVWGAQWVASGLTGIIGNLTWNNYFERQADSFTHENPHVQKNLLSGAIDFFKSRFTEEKREFQNGWYSFFFDPHKKIEDRIAKLSNQLKTMPKK